MKRDEELLQRRVARWLDSLPVLWCHYPAGGARPYGAAGSLAGQGAKKGVPDVLVFEACGPYHGLAVELKSAKGKVSPQQRAWLADLADRGWRTAVARTEKEVRDVVSEYLSLRCERDPRSMPHSRAFDRVA